MFYIGPIKKMSGLIALRVKNNNTYSFERGVFPSGKLCVTLLVSGLVLRQSNYRVLDGRG